MESYCVRTYQALWLIVVVLIHLHFSCSTKPKQRTALLDLFSVSIKKYLICRFLMNSICGIIIDVKLFFLTYKMISVKPINFTKMYKINLSLSFKEIVDLLYI